MERIPIGTRLGVAFGALVFVWVLFLLFFDIGEIDDSDLALPARKVDPAQNPYPETLNLELDLSEEERGEFYRVDGMLRGSEAMDSAFLIEMLERHRPRLERMHRYAAMETWPEPADYSFMFAKHWSHLVPLAVVKGAFLAGKSRRAEAVDSNLSILRFAAHIQSSQSCVISWSVACGMRGNAYRGLLCLLDREPMEMRELVQIAEAMEDPLLRSLHVAHMIRADYTSSKATLNVDVDPLGSRTRWIPQRAVFKENLTLLEIAESHRRALQLAETTLIEARAYSEAKANSKRLPAWIETLGGNRRGQEFVRFIESSLLESVQFSFNFRALHELLRTRVALERYRLDHGAWPPDLVALVPAYLDAVPLDPVDGKPLRYDRKRKVLYSIGNNLIDEKGIAPDQSGSLRSRDEIVIELEPKELAPWPDFGQPAPADN